MPLSPAIVVHMVFALGALVLGPFALFARKGSRLHRAAGYFRFALMPNRMLGELLWRQALGRV